MAIQTSVKRSFIYWNLLYLVLCGGLGGWGAVLVSMAHYEVSSFCCAFCQSL